LSQRAFAAEVFALKGKHLGNNIATPARLQEIHHLYD
jgi:hypothetical protein